MHCGAPGVQRTEVTRQGIEKESGQKDCPSPDSVFYLLPRCAQAALSRDLTTRRFSANVL